MAEERACEDHGHRHTGIEDQQQDRKEVRLGRQGPIEETAGQGRGAQDHDQQEGRGHEGQVRTCAGRLPVQGQASERDPV